MKRTVAISAVEWLFRGRNCDGIEISVADSRAKTTGKPRRWMGVRVAYWGCVVGVDQ